MTHYLVEIFWSDEDEGYIATVPDLPGCSAWGQTREDAAKEIEAAQTAWIQACQASGEPVPAPRTQARQAA